jgi:hypothetical protein
MTMPPIDARERMMAWGVRNADQGRRARVRRGQQGERAMSSSSQSSGREKTVVDNEVYNLI